MEMIFLAPQVFALHYHLMDQNRPMTNSNPKQLDQLTPAK